MILRCAERGAVFRFVAFDVGVIGFDVDAFGLEPVGDEAAVARIHEAVLTVLEAQRLPAELHGVRTRVHAKAEPVVFVVGDLEGPLRTGELTRAARWGAGLVRQAVR